MRHGLTAWTALCVLGAALSFWLPALVETQGVWPAPLDDVYIYFGHARATALGAPLSWFPGNGYSSGATSVIYPWLLAPAWALGLRGSALGIAAALLALACVFDACRSVMALVPARRWLVPPLVATLPLLGWSLWSGMETALWLMLLGRALRAADRGFSADAPARKRHQWRAGGWLALMVITRPETLALGMALGVAVVHGAGGLRTAGSLARTASPALVLLSLQAAVNRWQTGEWAQAGAVRKLMASDGGAAVAYLQNLVVLISQAFWRALGGSWGALSCGALVALALYHRRQRRLAVALCAGAMGGVLLVCLNTTARFQNYRYAAPMLAMLCCAAALGAAGRRGRVRLLWAAALVLLWLGELPRQTQHFARASHNILAQQAEVARRLRRLDPPPRRVLLNDAGVIPYLSELPPLDGLGLGGFRGMPFARASRQGEAAVIELIERLPAGERPDVMALYPGWWPQTVQWFGRRLDAVRITHNVICAADEKVIYAADWSALDAAQSGLDVGDLIDEGRHQVEAGGDVVGALLWRGDHRRWDGGRRGPLSFVAWRDARALRLRSDDGGEAALTIHTRAGRLEARAPAGTAGRWREWAVAVRVSRGERVVIAGEAPIHRLWLE